MKPTNSLASPEFRNLLDQCVHCGLCLPACPTYSVLQTEMDSPRGRIQLMNAAADGRIGIDGAFEEHIELCLGCRACETACPSGVQYGLLFEMARETIVEKRASNPVERGVRWLALRQMLPHRDRLRFVARLMRVYQATGLATLIRKLHFLPPSLQAMENLLPPLSLRFPNYSKPALAIGKKHGTVAFLYGCVQDAFLTNVNTSTVRVLQRNGYEVHFPQLQTCCGAAALHIGEGQLARDLARQNIDAFGGSGYDAIINNAGGCGATLKEYAHLLADDPAYAEKAKQFVAKLKDINEFLADHLHTPPNRPLKLRVTYVDSCHLRHGQKVVRQPRQLLNAIPGLTFVELQRPDMCCGSAGVYNIMQPETAEQVLDAKMADVAGTEADVVVVTNTGCHMQLIHGVQKKGLKAEVVHLVELLDRAYQMNEQWTDQSVLVIGGSGFIGARLVAEASVRQYKVAYTFAHIRPNLAATAYQIDLSQQHTGKLEQCIANEIPQVVIYCAVPHQADEKTHRAVSVEGVQQIFACLDLVSPTALFVYMSTDAIFGSGNGPYVEQSKPEPEHCSDVTQVYGRMRACGEEVTRHCWPNSIVVRTAIVNGYTIDGSLNSRLAGIVDHLQVHKPLPRFADRYITPTLVDNLVDAVLEIIQPEFSYRGTLHIAGSQRVTDYEYTRCLARHLGIDEGLVEQNRLDDSIATRQIPRDTSLDVTFTQGLLQTRLLNIEGQMTKLLAQHYS